MQSFNTRFNFLDLIHSFECIYSCMQQVTNKRLLNKHLRTSCFQRSVFPFCVSEFPRLIHNSERGRLTYFLFVHHSSGVKVWSMITVRGKKLLSSHYLYGRAMGLASFLYKAQTFFSGRMAEGLRSGPPNPIKRKAKYGYNSTSNNHAILQDDF